MPCKHGRWTGGQVSSSDSGLLFLLVDSAWRVEGLLALMMPILMIARTPVYGHFRSDVNAVVVLEALCCFFFPDRKSVV